MEIHAEPNIQPWCYRVVRSGAFLPLTIGKARTGQARVPKPLHPAGSRGCAEGAMESRAHDTTVALGQAEHSRVLRQRLLYVEIPVTPLVVALELGVAVVDVE